MIIILLLPLFLCLLLKKSIVLLIARYCYIIVGGVFYFVKLIIMVFIRTIEIEEGNFYLSDIDIIFIYVALVSIIPRIFGFLLMKNLIEDFKKLEDYKREVEHETFIEKVSSKVDRGYSRWSEGNINDLSIEKDLNNDNERISNNDYNNNNSDNNSFNNAECNNENKEDKKDNMELSINGIKRELYVYKENNKNNDKESKVEQKEPMEEEGLEKK